LWHNARAAMGSRFLDEALTAPQVIAEQLAHDDAAYRDLARRLRDSPPHVLLTLARGSSDHATGYLGYLALVRVGVPAASLPPSALTLYRAPLVARGALAFALSQSGQSPDVVESLAACRRGGALTVALVNDPESPLARGADCVLPMRAGAERSVAATKTYLASLSAIARCVATWADDSALLAGLSRLPSTLERALETDTSPLVDALADSERLMVLSRGPAFAIALEAALKLKETCGLQAEAFTEAEVQHGPQALVGAGYPLLVFAPRGPAQQAVAELAAHYRRDGARVILIGPPTLAGVDVGVPAAEHEWLDPIAQIQAFYPAVARLAEARGLDPDAPPRLQKVTRTR